MTNLKKGAAQVLALLLAFLLIPSVSGVQEIAYREYAPSMAALSNPYIGNVAWANDDSEREQPFTLVYANLNWAEFEPEPGVYDFARFEQENHFSLWRERGKKLIFRLVMDVPGDEAHRDIPGWLYELTGDGIDYDNSYGLGYSPNYDNPILIEAHARAIAAIGERYGGDSFLAFVQLGSLGHWGEWHVHEGAGQIPLEPVRDAYVAPYLTAFEDAKLMMRRPFAIAAETGMGLYNDTAGDRASTERWLDWINYGGDYNQTGEVNALVPMPDAYKHAPIGGELATSMPAEQRLAEQLDSMLDLFAQSHSSWVGPYSFVDIPRDGLLQASLDALNRVLGYRLRIASLAMEAQGNTIALTLTFANDGVAPFYFDWTAAVRVDGEVYPLDMRIGDVLPGELYTVVATVPAHSVYSVDVGILNPDTNEPGVALAMDVENNAGWYRLF